MKQFSKFLIGLTALFCVSGKQTVMSQVINEININPPSADQPYEYVELRGAPNASLAGYKLLAVDGDNANRGQLDLVLDLGALSFGSNGLLIVKAAVGGATPNAATTVVGLASLNTGGTSPLENGSMSILLVSGTGALTQGNDYDSNNDGVLELTGTPVIADAVGWYDTDGPATDAVYGGVILSVSSGIPAAATRSLLNQTPLSAAAWYCGNLNSIDGNSTNNYATTVAQRSANFPIGGVLTPGDENLPNSAATSVGILLNEVLANPSGSDVAHEYVEFRGTPNATIPANTYFFVIEGDAGASPGAGSVDLAVNLGGLAFGSNGLLVLRSASSTMTFDAASTVVNVAAFDASPLENGSISFLVVSNTPSIATATELDPTGSGTLSLPINAYIEDAICWSDGGASDKIYGAVLTQASGNADAATRFRGNTTPNSAAAWYSGDMVDSGAGAASLTYSSVAGNVSANFPAGGILTPGGINAPDPIIGFSVSTPSQSVNEGNSGSTPYTFSVTLTNGVVFPVTIDVLISGDAVNDLPGSTLLRKDYFTTPTSSNVGNKISFTFTQDGTQSFTASVFGDMNGENDNTATFTLQNAVNANLDGANATRSLTILNDDAAGTIAFSTASQTVAEGSVANTYTLYTYNIAISNVGDAPFSLPFTVGGTAVQTGTAVTDFYTNPVSTGGAGVVTLSTVGNTIQGSIKVYVRGDMDVESDETIILTLNGAPAYATITDAVRTHTIVNDDIAAAGSLTFAAGTPSTSTTEGNSGTKLVPIQVTLTGATVFPVVAQIDYNGSTALFGNTFGKDFHLTGLLSFLQLSFTANGTKYFNVVVMGDVTVETDEIVNLNLTSPTAGVTLGDVNRVVTILNDDGPRFGSDETPSIANLTLYPNPSQGRFAIDFSTETAGQVRLQIVDLSGRVVFEDAIEAVVGQNTREIDLTNAPAGVYALTLSQGDTTKRSKFVVR